jgi:adhesin transport system membrane fusion protein
MRRSDFAFANNLRAAVELETPRAPRLIVRASLVFLALGLFWAYFAVLDEVTRGQARVIPSRQMQIVQSLEGGLVQGIGVTEGDIVAPGQALMRIDDTAFGVQLGEISERRAALRARVARLEREVRGENADAATFPDDLRRDQPQTVASELALAAARARKVAQDVEVLDQQLGQKLKEREELAAQARRLAAGKPLLDRELTITRRLFSQRVVPEIEMLRLERQATELTGQTEVNQSSLLKAEGAIAEASARRDAVALTFRAAAEEDLTKTRSDLAVIEETIRAAQDRLRRTELKSPVRGIVNKVHLTTIGAVVTPGAALVEIVPLDDTLLLEAQIRPQDIGFIRADQEAVVKITAYDSAAFGSLQGKVERISADTSTDSRGESFYRVVVRTNTPFLGSDTNRLPIIPGMIGTVEILTGRKSVLSYLLKPARLLRDEALRER